MEGEAGVCPLSVHQEARVHGGCSTHSGHSRRHDMRHHLLGQLTAFKHSGSSKQPLLSSLTSFLLSCSAHSSHTRLYLFPRLTNSAPASPLAQPPLPQMVLLQPWYCSPLLLPWTFIPGLPRTESSQIPYLQSAALVQGKGSHSGTMG